MNSNFSGFEPLNEKCLVYGLQPSNYSNKSMFFLGGPLAQLDRVADFESVGWGFESSRGRHDQEKIRTTLVGMFDWPLSSTG